MTAAISDVDVTQLSRVRSAATAARRSLLALPHSFRTAADTDEQLVHACSAVLA